MRTIGSDSISINVTVGLLWRAMLLPLLLLLLSHALLLGESLLALDHRQELMSFLELRVIGADALLLHLLVFLRRG